MMANASVVSCQGNIQIQWSQQAIGKLALTFRICIRCNAACVGMWPLGNRQQSFLIPYASGNDYIVECRYKHDARGPPKIARAASRLPTVWQLCMWQSLCMCTLVIVHNAQWDLLDNYKKRIVTRKVILRLIYSLISISPCTNKNSILYIEICKALAMFLIF
jgi:hypothetical protein